LPELQLRSAQCGSHAQRVGHVTSRLKKILNAAYFASYFSGHCGYKLKIIDGSKDICCVLYEKNVLTGDNPTRFAHLQARAKLGLLAGANRLLSIGASTLSSARHLGQALRNGSSGAAVATAAMATAAVAAAAAMTCHKPSRFGICEI